MVAQSFRAYFITTTSGDPVGVGQTYVEVSDSVSALYQHYLDTTDWNDGWLDGVPFDRIAQPSPTTFTFTGLLVWGDDEGSFWLEPFYSVFELAAEDDLLTAYTLCFRTHDERGRPIPFNNSEAWVSRHIWIPEASEPNDESDWVYVFRKRLSESTVNR